VQDGSGCFVRTWKLIGLEELVRSNKHVRDECSGLRAEMASLREFIERAVPALKDL
jgi:hypothetical protein